MATTIQQIASLQGSSQVAGSTQPQHVLVVDGTGAAVSFGGSGGASQTDRSAFVEGTGVFTPIGGVFNDVVAAAVVENTAAVARITPNQAVHVNLRAQDGTELSAGAGVQYTETDTDTTITGTAIMFESNTGTSALAVVSSAAPLPVSAPSGAIASGAIASGAVASGAFASGSIASGAVASGAIAAGAIAVGAFAAGATSIADNEDAASASGDRGIKVLVIQKATPADTAGTDGDYANPQMSAGRIWASATIDAALPAGANAIGKLAANSGVTIGAVEIAAAQTLATVTTVSTVTAVTTLTGSGIAHDGVDSGNPHKIGAKALASPKGVTLVAAADRSDLYCDTDGMLLVKPGTAWGDLISVQVSNTDGASTAFSTFDNAAGTRNYITQITVHNAHATTNGYVDIRDGTAGAILWTIPLPATGGATIHFNPPLRQPTAATALAFDVSAAITTIYLSVNGFKSKV